jgi:hypothetical protein
MSGKKLSVVRGPLSVASLPAAFSLLLCAFCFLPVAWGQEATPTGAPAATAKQSAPAPAEPRMDAKSKDLLDKVIQALGGQAFLNYKTISSTGRAFSIYEGETTGYAPYESNVEPPDKRRFAYGKGQKVILINNGSRGWEFDRYGLIRQKPEKVERWRIAMRYSLEGLLRHIVREPGTLVLDGGTDFVDLLPVRVLEISDARRVDVKLDLERSTYLPTRITYRIQNPQSREWDVYAESYSEYREIQGIQTPMRLVRYVNGERVAEYFLSTALYNQEFPPGYFEPRR